MMVLYFVSQQLGREQSYNNNKLYDLGSPHHMFASCLPDGHFYISKHGGLTIPTTSMRPASATRPNIKKFKKFKLLQDALSKVVTLMKVMIDSVSFF